MNNEIIAQQAASCLPSYGPIADWAFCQNKETYLRFVREWKLMYRYLSADARYQRLCWRASQSNRAMPDNPKAKALWAQSKDPVKDLGLGEKPEWLKTNEALPNWKNPWKVGDKLTYGQQALASWMLNVRKEAKVKSHESYLRSKKSLNP